MLHADYLDAEVRTFTRLCPERGRHGISFDFQGTVIRLALTPESAAFLRSCMDDYMSEAAGTQASAEIHAVEVA